LEEVGLAYAIVKEYYEEARVVARDDREEFERSYFCDDAGVWLATTERLVIGCIALRALPKFAESGEIKRLYVKPAWRGFGIAEALLRELEKFAAAKGYRRLYLDTASDMLAAQRFYRQHGYERCERYNTNPQASIFMRKLLAAPEKL